MNYTVDQLAKLAGVTPRTLRFYDKIGLLRPAGRGKNGYRFYGEDELIRLQQIMFFRELDFPIAEIKKMMSDPRFDVIQALKDQKQLLFLKRAKIIKHFDNINETISNLMNKKKSDAKKLYGSFSEKKIDEYKEEVRRRWGRTEAYRQSQERVKKFTKEDWAKIKEEGDANMAALVALMLEGKKPESPEVQAEIVRHRAGINRFYDCSNEIYGGLAEMYLQDKRFGDHFRKYHPKLPEFLSQAMTIHCSREK